MFEEIKKRKESMTEYEYSRAMADMCALQAIDARNKTDVNMTVFFRNAQEGFLRRTLDLTWDSNTKSSSKNTKVGTIRKSMRNYKSGILKTGIKTRSGICIY